MAEKGISQEEIPDKDISEADASQEDISEEDIPKKHTPEESLEEESLVEEGSSEAQPLEGFPRGESFSVASSQRVGLADHYAQTAHSDDSWTASVQNEQGYQLDENIDQFKRVVVNNGDTNPNSTAGVLSAARVQGIPLDVSGKGSSTHQNDRTKSIPLDVSKVQSSFKRRHSQI